MSDDYFKQEQYSPTAPVKFNPMGGFEFTDLDGMYRAAQCYLQSGFAPSAFKTPQQLIICWARGAELGLKPLQAIDGMTVINQRIGIMGDLALAMVRNTGELAKLEREYTGEGDNLTCKLTIQRKGSAEKHFSFSVAEAKFAGIYERSATWRGYPKRMTYYRALGFGLRDEFSDVLKGLYTAEELEDLAHFENLAADKANVRYVDVDGSQEAATPTSSQTTTAPPPRNVPPLQAQLAKEHPEVIASGGGARSAAIETPVETKKEEKLMGPAADFAERSNKPGPPASALPDDIPMDTTALETEAAPPEKPFWIDHVIKGIKSFTERKEPDGTITPITRTVGSLTPTELALVETKWVPKVHERIAEASDAQLEDLKALEARIAHDKTAKPW